MSTVFYFIVIYNDDGSVSFWIWVVLAAAILTPVGCSMCQVCCCDDSQSECIFCKKKHVKDDDYWDRHKVKCLNRNTAFYSSLPRAVAAAACPRCHQPLKLWTRAGDEVRLSCHGENEKITTNGENLFICYLCDQYVCLDCTRLIESHNQEQGQVHTLIQGIINSGFASDPPPDYDEVQRNNVQQV